jgi:hypothetical protein
MEKMVTEETTENANNSLFFYISQLKNDKRISCARAYLFFVRGGERSGERGDRDKKRREQTRRHETTRQETTGK